MWRLWSPSWRVRAEMRCVILATMGNEKLSLHRISGAWTRKVMDSLERLGMDAEEICVRAKVDHQLLHDANSRVPRDALARFWAAAAAMSDDPLLGLHAGEQLGARYNHVLAMLMFTGKTLGDGIRLGLRYKHIIMDGRWAALDESGSDRVLHFDRVEDHLPTHHHQVEMLITASHELLRTITVNAFRPKEVRFAHRFRGLAREYERVFGCPVLFEQPRTEIVIAEGTWTLELEIWDPMLSGRLESLAAEVENYIDEPGLVGSVSLAIRRILPRGPCDLETVAKSLGMSDRTVQRRLHEQGTSFRELLDATRHSIVSAGIDQNVSRQELTRRAGFASTRALQRSLDRWAEESNPSAEPLPSELGVERD